MFIQGTTYRSVPFQAKAVAWDYLCEAVAPFRDMGLRVNQAELR